MNPRVVFVAFVLFISFNKMGFAVEAIVKIPSSIYIQIGVAISEAKRKGVVVEGHDIYIRTEGVQTFISFSNPSKPSPAKGQRGSPEGVPIFGVELQNGKVVSSSFVR